MPISAMDGYTAQHWQDVYAILTEALNAVGLDSQLVSDAGDAGVIHKRIIQNLYRNPVVVCDVSGKNPNVMFELGMRLTFDKPTIIVKDDQTSYSFDTSPIEHLIYPRDLRYSQIVAFKTELGEKVKGTLKASQEEGYTTFLKHFGPFTVPKLDTTVVSNQDFAMQQLRDDVNEMQTLLRAVLSRREPVERVYAMRTPGIPSQFVKPNPTISNTRALEEGMLVMGSKHAIYRIERGTLRWIPNPPTFDKMGFDWKAVRNVPDAQLDAIPRGEDYPSLA